MTTVLTGVDGVTGAVGSHLGYSAWLELTNEAVARFTAATGDPEPLVNGNFVLALSNFFLPQIVDVREVSMGVNYGTGRVCFPRRARVGSRLRAGAELVSAEPVPGGVQTIMRITIETEGEIQPACVIESLSRYLA